MVTRKTSIIYKALLVIALMLVIPGMDAHAQTATDINKPTRERVKNKKAEQGKKDEKQEAAPAKKQETAPVKKQETTPAKKQETKAPSGQDVKSGDKQASVKPAVGQDGAKSITDTAAKAAEQQPKVRKTLNTATTDFDGIDVSKHQGDINWEQLKKNTKIKFVYIKATEGSDYIDPRYKQNIKEARRHGFKVGSYHFLTNKSSATSQFINFAKTANRDEQDLLPIIDVEVCKQWTSQQLRDSLKVFADLLEDYYGCKPMIYTSEKFFTKNLGRAFADYPLFVAKYNSVQPNIGYRWILWQFADNGLFKGAVKGNFGEVDLSRFNKGCTINDILYKPAKGKPKISVMDAVDKNKEKPATINLTEQQSKTKEVPKTSAKQQKEEEQKKADRAKKANERDKRVAEEEAKKKAKEKADADKKAKAQADRDKREKERQQAKDKKAKEEAAAKQRKAAEQKARADAEAKQKAAEKAEAEAKAKRKAAAQKAKQEKANQQSNTRKQNKSASLLGTSSSKMSQAQQGDSIRNARYQGRKTNKSSADND